MLLFRKHGSVSAISHKALLFIAFPVHQLYPEHVRDRGLNGQQVHLLIAQPELSGVVRRKIAEAFFVWNPVFVEVDRAIASLENTQNVVSEDSRFKKR